MKNRWKTVSLSLIAFLILISVAFSAILYTITRPTTWQVKTDYGLELYESDGITVVSNIHFNPPRYGNDTQIFILKNLSNGNASVSMMICNSTTEYTFSSNWTDSLMRKNESKGFWVSLMDIDMLSETLYIGEMRWHIVI